ncbi:MAG TPA: pilus assembly protein PilP [Polyangiaceae bacterium]
MRRALVGFGLLGAVALAGCEDDVAQDRSNRTLSAGSAAPSAGPPAVPAAPPARREFPEAEFTETERSRDPFRPYAKKFAEEAQRSVRSQRQVVLAEFSVDDLKLIGIVTRLEPARAMLVDPSGKGHVVRRGDFVGRADVVQLAGASGATYELNWRLDRIRDGDVVLVREDPNNPDVPAATKVIPLRPEGGVVTGG